MNPKGSIPRHTIIKTSEVKDKETLLKVERGKKKKKKLVSHKGIPIRLSVDFSAETLRIRRE